MLKCTEVIVVKDKCQIFLIKRQCNVTSVCCIFKIIHYIIYFLERTNDVPFFAVCRLLEQEKTDHRDLKETWRKANEEFLEQQTMLCWEIENMRDLMTPAQNEKLSRRYRLKHSAPAKSKQAKTIKTVAEEPYSVGNMNDDLIKFDDSPKKGQVPMPKPVTPSGVHLSEVGNAMWLLTGYEINS